MKLKCLRYFYFIFACLISSSQGQTADECVTCVLGDFLKSGWSGLESWFGNNLAPATAGTLKFFDPNLGTNDSPLNFVKPETDPVEEKLNDLPGTGRNPDAPIETEVIANPTDDKNCDPNGAGANVPGTNCAVDSPQIIWPEPSPCGDQTQTERIRTALNKLVPTGGVLSFSDKCGIAFFTASLSPLEIQQLMSENIGIAAIAPDEKVEIGTDTSSKMKKREDENVQSARVRLSKIRKREDPSGTRVRIQQSAQRHLAYISTSPLSNIDNDKYAWVIEGGAGVTIYWIDTEFYIYNIDMTPYNLQREYPNQLSAENALNLWAWPQADHGGCMLSIIGSKEQGIVRSPDLRLKIVKVDPKTSSFLSGLQKIIQDLEDRIAHGKTIARWTIIGTALTIPFSVPGIPNQSKATTLIKRLIDFDVVIVVSAGTTKATNILTESSWPASIAKNPAIPILVVGSIDMDTHSVSAGSPQDAFVSLHAPDTAYCTKGASQKVFQKGTDVAAAIVTGLAADFLSREEFRMDTYLDRPDQIPPSEKHLIGLSTSAKLRDYMISLSYDRLDPRRQGRLWGVNVVWNGVNPDTKDVYDGYCTAQQCWGNPPPPPPL